MTKILLVEDDKSLREIYGVRLFAEGYDVISADDGEQALAVAIKERPSLIITDVMMPKISGYDMLDILRSTSETKDIKVIVMTALGSEENKERSERLGADRHLVKSQVGIEDVVNVVHELLNDKPAGQQAMPAAPAAAAGIPQAAPNTVRPAPATPVPQRQPIAPPPPTAPPPMPPVAPSAPPRSSGLVSSPTLPAPGMPANQASNVQTPPQQPPTPPQQASPAPSPSSTASEPPSRRTRVIQPISDPTKKVDIQALVDRELAKEGEQGNPISTANEEKQVVEDQINNFVNQPSLTPTQSTPSFSQPQSSPIAPSQLPPVNPQSPPPNPPATPPAAPTV